MSSNNEEIDLQQMSSESGEKSITQQNNNESDEKSNNQSVDQLNYQSGDQLDNQLKDSVNDQLNDLLNNQIDEKSISSETNDESNKQFNKLNDLCNDQSNSQQHNNQQNREPTDQSKDDQPNNEAEKSNDQQVKSSAVTKEDNKEMCELSTPVLQHKLNNLVNTLTSCIAPIWNSFKSNKSLAEKETFIPFDSWWEVEFESIDNITYINQGAQGSIYKGEFKNYTIAVKKMKDPMSKIEINILKGLRHNNIVRFLGICKDPSCILMEYSEIGNLAQYLQARKDVLDPETIWEFAFQIATGMNYLHHKEITHRDLKCANILVFDENQLKICDFDTCKKVKRPDKVNMTFVGTYAWMAPELLRNQKCCAKVDVWSYGVVLWEILTAEVPYQNVDNVRIGADCIQHYLTLPISTECPKGFRLLLEMCFTQKPDARPSFKSILVQLQISCKEQMYSLSLKQYNIIRRKWRAEIKETFDHLTDKSHGEPEEEKDIRKINQMQIKELQNTINVSREILNLYQENLNRFNELVGEVDNLVQTLKVKEAELDERLKKEKELEEKMKNKKESIEPSKQIVEIVK